MRNYTIVKRNNNEYNVLFDKGMYGSLIESFSTFEQAAYNACYLAQMWTRLYKEVANVYYMSDFLSKLKTASNNEPIFTFKP